VDSSDAPFSQIFEMFPAQPRLLRRGNCPKFSLGFRSPSKHAMTTLALPHWFRTLSACSTQTS